MYVSLNEPGRPARFVHGPADIPTDVAPRSELIIVGDYDEREAIRWASALGLAAARGVTVRRYP